MGQVRDLLVHHVLIVLEKKRKGHLGEGKTLIL